MGPLPVSRVTRRRFLQVCGGAAVLSAAPGGAVLGTSSTYRVGVGRDLDAYAATTRAVASSQDWAGLGLAGKTVVIKPNLVLPVAATTGAITEPECVRALADLALADGASQVFITEGAGGADFFEFCGYTPLDGYAGGLVTLLDARTTSHSLYAVPGGLTYGGLWQRDFVMDPSVVFISAAKLKTHVEGQATLSMKNLIGLLPSLEYPSAPPYWPRFSMHHRGLHEAIVDMNLVRPIDFAVVEGIWGMEGLGPLNGTPIFAQTVLAGSNAVAVDRLALYLMGMGQHEVKYLSHASRAGLGPCGLGEIQALGDALVPLAFARTPTTPPIEPPRAFPQTFDPAAGGQTCLVGWYAESVDRSIQVVRAYDDDPTVTLVRDLAPTGSRNPGFELVRWDGRANDGSLVPPGRYGIHVTAAAVGAVNFLPPPAYALSWVDVI